MTTPLLSWWRGKWAPWLAVALLAAWTALLYARVSGYPFLLFDDNRYVTENPQVRAGLTWSGVAWAFSTLHASNWHPLTWLSHMLDVQLFGLNAGAHHLVNVAWHVASTVLLFVVLSRMTGAPGRSLIVAALFAVHPLHVESVAWVAERKDVLSTFFGLLGLGAYARYAERPRLGRYLAVVLCFALSLLAKPMGVTQPFLLLVLDWWPLRRVEGSALALSPAGLETQALPWLRLVLEKLPLVALSAASSAVTLVAQSRGGSMTGLELPLGPRLANAVVSYARYLLESFWPHPLSIFYPYPEGGFPAWQVIGALALLSVLTALAVREARRQPWLLAGWLWFLGTLVPVIGIVQVGGQSMAERYTYMPIVGLFVAGVWTAYRVAGTWRGGLPLAAAAVAVLVALSGATSVQLGYWSSHARLFKHALEAGGESALVRGTLSEGLRRSGKLEEALVHARAAVRLDPHSARLWNNLGVSALEVGKAEEAHWALEQAIQIDPGHLSSWLNMADVELRLGSAAEAVAAADRATQLAPDEPQGWYRLGEAYAVAGRPEQAVRSFREAVRLRPDQVAAWSGMAASLLALGRSAEAGTAFEEVAHLQPGNPVAWRNLGVYYQRTGRPFEAMGAFRQALKLRPGDAEVASRLEAVEAELQARGTATP
jgi:Flp pilus assembly protein TadD